MDFMKEYLKYQDEIIKHTKNLVAINSTCVENEVVDGVCYRFGMGNFKALEYVLKLGEEFGFQTIVIRSIPVWLTKSNTEQALRKIMDIIVVKEDYHD